MFTGGRVYDTMDTAMPADKARQWFGNAPPDLSLITRSRGTDYVYTFLRVVLRGPVAADRREQRRAAGDRDAARARGAPGPAAAALRNR